MPDVLFRWSTAIGTLVLDTILLLLTLLVARGLPTREAFALRRPTSWGEALRVGLLALGATWLTSLALELAVGHAVREQAVPQYSDPTRLAPFIANFVVIAVYVPVVEESLCRGLGYGLLEAWGTPLAIVGSAVAFALAHGAVLDLPWVLVTGLGLAYLRSRTGSLYPCVALHATVNGIAMVASVLIAAPPPV
ncbi:MAG TPA: CPBP family intramembrane glutamic endopeptidase [Candidatus Limnocylindria bacterium]|nr:CPBP family intramembrane glutamic endopeptidase [Candidatus Limnocylindria bacterium]